MGVVVDFMNHQKESRTTYQPDPTSIPGQDPKWGHGHAAHDDVKGYSYGAAETLEH